MVGVKQVFCRAVDVDVEVADLAGLRRLLADLGAVKSWIAAREVAVTRRIDVLAREGVPVVAEFDLAEHGNTSRREADQVRHRDEALQAVPQMEPALAAGEISTGHVDALHRSLAGLVAEDRARLAADGERITRIATQTSPDLFAKKLKDLALQTRRDDGIDRFEGGIRRFV